MSAPDTQIPAPTPQPSPSDRRTASVAWAVATIVVALVVAFIAWLALGQDRSGPAADPAAPAETGQSQRDEDSGDDSVADDRPDSDAAGDEPATDEVAEQAPSPEVEELLLSLPRRDADDVMAAGELDAPVVMIEYADYRCPYCARFHLETRPGLQPLVDDGTLRIEFRDLVLFEETSELAALAARAAAEQGLRDEFQTAIFELSLAGHAEFDRDDLIELAGELGMADLEAFEAALDDEEALALVQADSAEARSIGISSTPTFLVNTQVVQGAQPLEVFTQIIEREEQKALARQS